LQTRARQQTIFLFDQRAAAFVGKIRKGANSTDLAIERPTKIELTINLKMAKAFVLTVPATLLACAESRGELFKSIHRPTSRERSFGAVVSYLAPRRSSAKDFWSEGFPHASGGGLEILAALVR
jgi:hypothetical protein